MFGWKANTARTTNWNTQADGTITQSNCRYYPSSDGTYELEFVSSDQPIGLVLETNAYGNYAIVKSIAADAADVVKKVVTLGDVLVAVNNHVMIHEEFSDTITFLEMLREGQLERRLRLLNPRKCPVAIYAERMAQQQKCHKDMFGFLRSLEYLQKERRWKASRISIDAQRDIDWIEYLKSIGGADNLKPSGMFRSSPELKKLVRRGIPVAYRALVWPKISLAGRYRQKYPDNYYQELLSRKHELDPKVEIDIDKDTDRTFPEHDYYSGGGGGCAILKRVLVAHALHNPTIGYCQSLNFVAGMMLLFMEEEEAFWMFITVVDTLLPHDYYTASMVGTYIDQFVFSHIIKTRLDKIHRVLEGASLQLPLVTVQWFMCLFVNALPPETALRVWDMFLNEGCKVLFRIAVGLFKLHEKQLLAAKDAGEVYTILKGMGRNVIDADVLIATAYRSYTPPEKVSNIVYASARNGVGVHNNKQYSYASSATKATSSWIASQVPSVLVGIGLAHTGPKQEVSSPPASPPSTGASSDRSPVVTMAKSVLNILGTRTNAMADMNQSSGSSSGSEHALPSMKRLGRPRDYRSFSRLDLEKWRAQFRPQVEERFENMEKARIQWKEQEEQERRERVLREEEEAAKKKKAKSVKKKYSPLILGNLSARDNILRDTSGKSSKSGECEDNGEGDSFPTLKKFSSDDMWDEPTEFKSPLKTPPRTKEEYRLSEEGEAEIFPDDADYLNTTTNQYYSSEEEENDYEQEEVDTTSNVQYKNTNSKFNFPEESFSESFQTAISPSMYIASTESTCDANTGILAQALMDGAVLEENSANKKIENQKVVPPKRTAKKKTSGVWDNLMNEASTLNANVE